MDNVPDELLEKILLLAIARDLDGRIARAIYSVSRHWNRIISPVLYRHLAWRGSNISDIHKDVEVQESAASSGETLHSTRPESPTLLFDILEANATRVHISHLFIHDNIVSAEHLRLLAYYSHCTLQTLTIWPSREMHSRLRFFDETTETFPNLTHVTFVGDIVAREKNRLSCQDRPPRFPRLTHIRLVGPTTSYPSFAHPDDVPMLANVCYSHLSFTDAGLMLQKVEHGMEWLRRHPHKNGPLAVQIKHRVVYHASPPENALESTKLEFERRCDRLRELMKEPWAKGMSLVVKLDDSQRPHNRSPEEDNWEAVLNRLMEDDV